MTFQHLSHTERKLGFTFSMKIFFSEALVAIFAKMENYHEDSRKAIYTKKWRSFFQSHCKLNYCLIQHEKSHFTRSRKGSRVAIKKTSLSNINISSRNCFNFLLSWRSINDSFFGKNLRFLRLKLHFNWQTKVLSLVKIIFPPPFPRYKKSWQKQNFLEFKSRPNFSSQSTLETL